MSKNTDKYEVKHPQIGISLPPGVEGEISGELTIETHCLMWKLPKYYNKQCEVYFKWWGDSSENPGTYFMPVTCGASRDLNLVEKHIPTVEEKAFVVCRYPIRTIEDIFAKYLKDLSSLKISVRVKNDGQSNDTQQGDVKENKEGDDVETVKVGETYLITTSLNYDMPNHKLKRWLSVHDEDGICVGSLLLSVGMISYNERISVIASKKWENKNAVFQKSMDFGKPSKSINKEKKKKRNNTKKNKFRELSNASILRRKENISGGKGDKEKKVLFKKIEKNKEKKNLNFLEDIDDNEEINEFGNQNNNFLDRLVSNAEDLYKEIEGFENQAKTEVGNRKSGVVNNDLDLDEIPIIQPLPEEEIEEDNKITKKKIINKEINVDEILNAVGVDVDIGEEEEQDVVRVSASVDSLEDLEIEEEGELNQSYLDGLDEMEEEGEEEEEKWVERKINSVLPKEVIEKKKEIEMKKKKEQEILLEKKRKRIQNRERKKDVLRKSMDRLRKEILELDEQEKKINNEITELSERKKKKRIGTEKSNSKNSKKNKIPKDMKKEKGLFDFLKLNKTNQKNEKPTHDNEDDDDETSQSKQNKTRSLKKNNKIEKKEKEEKETNFVEEDKELKLLVAISKGKLINNDPQFIDITLKLPTNNIKSTFPFRLGREMKDLNAMKIFDVYPLKELTEEKQNDEEKDLENKFFLMLKTNSAVFELHDENDQLIGISVIPLKIFLDCFEIDSNSLSPQKKAGDEKNIESRRKKRLVFKKKKAEIVHNELIFFHDPLSLESEEVGVFHILLAIGKCEHIHLLERRMSQRIADNYFGNHSPMNDFKKNNTQEIMEPIVEKVGTIAIPKENVNQKLIYDDDDDNKGDLDFLNMKKNNQIKQQKPKKKIGRKLDFEKQTFDDDDDDHLLGEKYAEGKDLDLEVEDDLECNANHSMLHLKIVRAAGLKQAIVFVNSEKNLGLNLACKTGTNCFCRLRAPTFAPDSEKRRRRKVLETDIITNSFCPKWNFEEKFDFFLDETSYAYLENGEIDIEVFHRVPMSKISGNGRKSKKTHNLVLLGESKIRLSSLLVCSDGIKKWEVIRNVESNKIVGALKVELSLDEITKKILKIENSVQTDLNNSIDMEFLRNDINDNQYMDEDDDGYDNVIHEICKIGVFLEEIKIPQKLLFKNVTRYTKEFNPVFPVHYYIEYFLLNETHGGGKKKNNKRKVETRLYSTSSTVKKISLHHTDNFCLGIGPKLFNYLKNEILEFNLYVKFNEIKNDLLKTIKLGTAYVPLSELLFKKLNKNSNPNNDDAFSDANLVWIGGSYLLINENADDLNNGCIKLKVICETLNETAREKLKRVKMEYNWMEEEKEKEKEDFRRRKKFNYDDDDFFGKRKKIGRKKGIVSYTPTNSYSRDSFREYKTELKKLRLEMNEIDTNGNNDNYENKYLSDDDSEYGRIQKDGYKNELNLDSHLNSKHDEEKRNNYLNQKQINKKGPDVNQKEEKQQNKNPYEIHIKDSLPEYDMEFLKTKLLQNFYDIDSHIRNISTDSINSPGTIEKNKTSETSFLNISNNNNNGIDKKHLSNEKIEEDSREKEIGKDVSLANFGIDLDLSLFNYSSNNNDNSEIKTDSNIQKEIVKI